MAGIVKVLPGRQCWVHVRLWPHWMFYSHGCLSIYSAERDKRLGYKSPVQTFAKADLRKSWCFEMICQRHGNSNKRFPARRDQKAEGRAAQPVTYPARQSNRDWVSFYSVCRWRVPSRMRFSSSRRSLQFPLWLLTSLARPREAVAWGIWKTPAGNERNFCFSFSLNHPLTPCSLYFGCLCAAGLLSFLLFLNAAQQ